MSEELPASLAVDGDLSTHSCTTDATSFPWWFVDLAQDYNIANVTVTLPSVGGPACNYHQSVNNSLMHVQSTSLHEPHSPRVKLLRQ